MSNPQLNESETGKKSNAWLAPFGTIWAGQAFSLLGSNLVQFALVWWLTQESGSATVLATASLVAFLPEVLLSPFAGALVDRWNRRWVMIIADGGIALATLALIALFWTDVVQFWHIYVILMIRSSGGIFHWAAMQASTSLMVPEQHLSRVNGLNASLNGGLRIIAPPLGAILIKALPMHFVLSVDVVTALLAIGSLVIVAIPQPQRASQSEASFKGVWQDMLEGARYAWAWTGLVLIMGFAALLNFFLTPTHTFLPLLVTEFFKGDVWQLSYLEVALGIGVVLGGLLLTAWGGFKRRIVTALAAISFMSVGLLLLAVAPPNAYWMAVAGLAIMGFFNPIANGPIFAILQSKVSPEMQGRVFTLLSAVASAMVPLSMVVSGPLVEWLGIKTWYWVAGGTCLVLSLAAFLVVPLINIEQQQDPTSKDEAASKDAAHSKEAAPSSDTPQTMPVSAD